jgi:putative ABC transport system ATP-binding protein
MTIMIVTHNPRVAAKAKRVLYIRDGQIAASKELRKGGDSVLELDNWLKGLQFNNSQTS